MASVSVSHMIIFIASIVVAASVAGVLTTEVDRLSQAIDERGLDVSQQVRTDIEIISDPGSANCCYDGTNVTLLVKNVGSRTLPTDGDGIEVVLDGRYDPDVNATVLDGTTWGATDVARVNVTEPGLPAGDHRVKVVVDGDEEVLAFRT